MNPLFNKQIILGHVPSKSNSYKVIKIKGHGSLAKTDILLNYEKAFFFQCSHYRNKMIGLFEIEVDFFFRSMASDLDGGFKIIMDCLQNSRAIKNDNQCVRIVAQKFVDKDRPRVEFSLKAV